MEKIDYQLRFIYIFLYMDDMVIRDKLKDRDVKFLIYEHDNGDSTGLQDFIGKYIRNEYTWMTSIGIIEAMELVIEDAIGNGNITPLTLKQNA